MPHHVMGMCPSIPDYGPVRKPKHEVVLSSSDLRPLRPMALCRLAADGTSALRLRCSEADVPSAAKRCMIRVIKKARVSKAVFLPCQTR